MNSSPAEAPERTPPTWLHTFIEPYFPKLMALLAALVTALTALVALLQVEASQRSQETLRDSQYYAIQAIGHQVTAHQAKSYDTAIFELFNEWDWRQYSLEMFAADNPQASAVGRTAARAGQVRDALAPLSRLLNPPYAYQPDLSQYEADTEVITTTLLTEESTLRLEQSSAWANKANIYVTILTLLAISLLFCGLTTSIGARLRYLLAAASILTALVGGLWTTTTATTAMPARPRVAMWAYAQGVGLQYTRAYSESVPLFDQAVALAPDYAAAYYRRAYSRSRMGLHAESIPDYLSAIGLERRDARVYWDLGWAYYLLGDYPKALEADQQALAADPDLFIVPLNMGLALLAAGRAEEAQTWYDRGVTLAADQKRVPPPVRRFYLWEAIKDLDRLLAVLAGEEDVPGAPDPEHVDHGAEVQQQAQQILKWLKGVAVSLEYRGTAAVKPGGAAFGPLDFSSDRGKLEGAEAFPIGTRSITITVDYQGMEAGYQVVRQVQVNGRLSSMLSRVTTWNESTAGVLQDTLLYPFPDGPGFDPGQYEVEYYVEGGLIAGGRFAIR